MRHTDSPPNAPQTPRIAVLKSWRFGDSKPGTKLPYRMDYLRDHGYELVWSDAHLDRPKSRVLGQIRSRSELWGAPWYQLWTLRRSIRSRSTKHGVDAVLAMFESEGHAYAMLRGVSRRVGRDLPPLIVIGCWLTEILQELSEAANHPRSSGTRRSRLRPQRWAASLRLRWYRWTYANVDRLVVFSSNQRPLLASLLNRDPDSIDVVGFGVDVAEVFATGRQRSGTGPTVPVADEFILAVGRDRGRDWQTLLEAVAESDWAVEVIARPHFLAGLDIPTEVTVLPPVDRDRYLQRVNDAAAVLIITHDVAYPTGQTVMLEAMALGKPIIATQTEALGEYFDDGVDAVGTALADPDDLRSHISNLLNDPGRRARIGQAGSERVRERGDAQSMWSAIAGLLDQTLAVSRTDR